MNAYLTSREATTLLDVKPQTLYAYVSRGLVHSVPVNDGSKERLYLRADVEKLRTRADARSGHGAVAAAAMHYGQPVITSEITEVTEAGPVYRGMPALELARTASFEDVSSLLWTGSLAPADASSAVRAAPKSIDALCRELSARYGDDAMPRLFAAYTFGCSMAEPETPIATARAVMFGVTGCFGYLSPKQRYRSPRAGESIAHAVLKACGLPADAAACRGLNAALILLADYELASATFVARVAAASGADLTACIVAAIEASFGWAVEHGRVEQLLAGVTSVEEVRARLETFRAAGHVPPGFQPNLHAEHDPRAAALLEHARDAGTHPLTEIVSALLAEERGPAGLHAKAVLGVEVFARALALPRGAVPGIFLLARMAGWVAHILEQYGSDTTLRPRAKFTPPKAAI